MTARLDVELVRLGLARSRTQAAAAVSDGRVRVDGRTVTKASFVVGAEHALEIDDAGWVGRAALKLDAALDAFGIPVDGVVALDVGASTGGFTQVLLARGARQVLAIDVGHDQMDPQVRSDPRVVAVDGLNARDLDPAVLAAASGVDAVPALAVVDVSFISLIHVLPALTRTIAPEAPIVALVKPQFEVGKGGVRGGIVVDPEARATAVLRVLEAAWALGLRTAGVIPSPIPGHAGNLEVVVHLARSRGLHPSEWTGTVNGAVGRSGT